MKPQRFLFLAACLASLFFVMNTYAQTPNVADVLTKAKKLGEKGNYKEARDLVAPFLEKNDSGATPEQVAELMQLSHDWDNQLGKGLQDLDDVLPRILTTHPENWRVLLFAAQMMNAAQHFGSMVNGEFIRGSWDGQHVNVVERDRVQTLLWARRASEAVLKDALATPAQRSHILQKEAVLWLGSRAAWQFQNLTDLTKLPEIEIQESGRGNRGWQGSGNDVGYPVDAAGKPVFFKLPASWETAENDGERWRWLLQKASEVDPASAAENTYSLASLLNGWLDVQTLRSSLVWPLLLRNAEDGADEGKINQSIVNLPSLAENETITKLATGVTRFTLPAEFDYMRMLKDLAAGDSNMARAALRLRAQTFENRRQRDAAAATWTELRDRFQNDQSYFELAEARLKQIQGNLGKLEPSEPQPAGSPASIDLVFRNAAQVKLVARPVKVAALLDAVKTEFKARAKGSKGRTQNTEWTWLQQTFGALLQGNVAFKKGDANRFLGDVSDTWTEALEPAPKHADKRVTLKTPLTKAGVYLVELQFADGNTTRGLVEIVDLVALTKPRADEPGQWGFVADAVTGKPVASADVSAFGYRNEYRDRSNRPNEVWFTSEQNLKSDAQGGFALSSDKEQRFQWLLDVKTTDGRQAIIGFSRFYHYLQRDALEESQQLKLFIATDRPVYRPAQKVHFSAWARRATYEEGKNGNEFANQKFTCEVNNPRGEKVFSQEIETDAQGAFHTEFTLPENATLGAYSINISNGRLGGSEQFRVEEYKKPEYEVTVKTPEKPVMLGEAFTATVEAKYFFGGAVTNAKVHYKVERTKHESSWFPVRPWDWLYGAGYWWRNSDYYWLDGFKGSIRCSPYWWPRQTDPPEIIAEATVSIEADGTIKIPIDTALTKELHGDDDHRYQITAEVVDSSRRMIVGSGSVVVPRQPYQVYVWTDRGYYEANAKATVNVMARTAEGKAVKGSAILRVLSVRYDDKGEPVEEEKSRFELESSDEKAASQVLQFPSGGQYRLAVEFTDEAGHKIEGTANTTVHGDGFDGKDFRFPDLEVVAEKPEYAPGEEASFVINTDQEGGTALIFERPANGQYSKPRTVTITKGKSTSFKLPIASNDQPNFFLEVVTIHNAKIHSQIVNVPVPPAKRIAEVQLTPSQETYKPQADGSVLIRVTRPDGTPIQGRVLLTGYDKALEYISGGSNVSAIRDFFWGWKRNHYASGINSLSLVTPFMQQEGFQWQPIGIFGNEAQSFGGAPRNGLGGRLNPRSAMMSRSLSGVSMDMSPSDPYASPAPAAAPMMEEAKMKGNAAIQGVTDSAQESPEAEVTIRQDFADLLVWNTSAETDADGNVTMPIHFPDDLTTWKFKAWVLGPNTEVGEAQVEVISRKDLLVRLQAPRFFVERDEVVLSGIVHNDHKDAQNVRAVLELDGKTLAPMEGQELEQRHEVASHGEHRFEWRVKVLEEGEATIRIKAMAAAESDAVEKKFPVFVHGMERQDAWSLSLRPDQTDGVITFNVPEKRRPAQTRLELRYSPSLATSLVDALPFLVSYPHGCTEQTLNRFVPTVITQQVLRDLGVDLKSIRDKRSTLNAQELGDPAKRAEQRRRFKDQEPVFDEATVQKMTAAGIERLQSMQASDGGWGWWPGANVGTAHLTAQVVDGLSQAMRAGATVPLDVLQRGVQWLERYEKAELARLNLPKETPNHKTYPDDYDAFVHGILASVKLGDKAMRERLFNDRLRLSKSMQATVGIACAVKGETDRRDTIVRNLEQFQKTDAENQTAWLDFGNNHRWWYWQDDEIESLGLYLKLRLTRDAKDSIAPQLVKYLLNNRKHGTYWRSTRDTAAAISALATYVKVSGENAPDMKVELWLDGKMLKEVPINQENLFTYDSALVLTGEELSSGDHKLEIKRKGSGPLYANAYLTCFTLEDHLRAAGLEVRVERNLYKLIPEKTDDLVAGSRGQALTQQGARYRREPLPEDAQVVSGDLIEVELITESKNDYEYLMLEDFKPAGCEAVDLQSGYVWNQGLSVYREFRDEKVTFYIENLPRGKRSLTYRLRAEIPGKFSALPSVITGMYAPELKGNSEERSVNITDAP